ncbi:MAG: cobalamin B12-binding domain-containing protein [Chloroflexi bacterium]|nr:cobalamin B12-binding domain-containing protein [Chloroflexota bacterium]
MRKKRPIRVLLSKVGLDGHNWGILVVARALTDAGMEVIYLGRHRTPQEIAQAALQEDVDVVGISSLVDGHRALVPQVVDLLRERNSPIPVILGGFIPPEDLPELKAKGVAQVFGVHTKLDDIVSWIKENAKTVTG